MGCRICTSHGKNVYEPEDVDIVLDKKETSREVIKIQFSDFIQISQDPIEQHYTISKTISKKRHQTTVKAMHKQTLNLRLIKSIKKCVIIKQGESRVSLINTLNLIKQADHPNLVKLFEIYEEEHYLHFVTEYVEGGELFEILKMKKQLTEPIAKHYITQLLQVISYCHSIGLSHIWIKPENLLLEQAETYSILKVSDFGIYELKKHSRLFDNQLSPPFYLAPDILEEHISNKADIWSCGAIMYNLLTGIPPFEGNTIQQICHQIRQSHISYTISNFDTVSLNAKHLINQMLNRDWSNRPPAQELLQHTWIVNQDDHTGRWDNGKALNNLVRFHTQYKLQQALLAFISNQLVGTEEIRELEKVFRTIDQNNDGRLSQEELLKVFQSQFPSHQVNSFMSSVMQNIDMNLNDYIDYSEFIMGAIRQEKLLNQEYLEFAFSCIDKDHSGKISVDEIREVLGNQKYSMEEWQQLINEADIDGDGQLDIQEFKKMMVK